MKRSYSKAGVSVLALFMLVSLFGCAQRHYSIDQLQADLAGKYYTFTVLDAEEDFLPTTRKRIQFKNEVLDVYLYEKAEDMEQDAERIDIGGSSYETEGRGINVSWISLPHFFKKGTIIVQYIGENDVIVSDLTDILGEEFAGYGKIRELYPDNPE